METPVRGKLALGFFASLGPLFLAAMVGSAYGIRWAAIEALWLYATMCLIFVTRNPAWPRRHLVQAFALYTLSWSSVLFAIVTFVVIQFGGPPPALPAWGTAAVSLALGGSATAALWPAQRRFYGRDEVRTH
jgi:hypothetical protein